MKKRLTLTSLAQVFMLCLIFFSNRAEVLAATKLNDKTAHHVVLVTLDGVRWQEVFENHSPFDFVNHFFSLYGWLHGDRKKNETITVSNTENISLPAYQSLMAGRDVGCKTNDCDVIEVETMQERIQREFGLAHTAVATFSSWDRIARAAQRRGGRTFVNSGIVPVDMQEIGGYDPIVADLNSLQEKNRPDWSEARADEYTIAQAFYYLYTQKPTFLYISLNDSDEWAHRSDITNYRNTLAKFDQWISKLVQIIQTTDGLSGNTTLIITTDHGRGNGDSWHAHGSYLPESKYVWIAGVSSLKKNHTHESDTELVQKKRLYRHADIRSTVEYALGLEPLECVGCGQPILEIFK